jgi:alpha-beta hydrolase superfamily lysophospholipase
MSRVRWKFYPEGRHEMLNETNRVEVIRNLLDWLESQVCGPV